MKNKIFLTLTLILGLFLLPFSPLSATDVMKTQIKVFDDNLREVKIDFDAFPESFRKGAYLDFDDSKKDIIIGAGTGGGPQVRGFDHNGQWLGQDFFAYQDNFRGGVKVASCDIDGDGENEIVTGAGSTGGPQVRVFRDRQPILQFFAYNKNFRGGVNVTCGDTNGNGKDEIITGTGPDGGPQIRVFNDQGQAIWQTMAFHPNYRGGISVASGDIDGDGQADIVTSQLSEGQAWIKSYQVNDSKNVISQFLAYPSSFEGGAYVATGDTNGDGKDEIITGAGEGGSPQVRVFYENGQWAGKQVFAYNEDYSGGVIPATGDTNQDGKEEIITSPAPKAKLVKKCERNCVALTIDDGYSNGGSFETMLDVLKRRKVKATFFILGDAMQGRPATIKRITDEGHQLANHSYSHPSFTRISEGRMKHEINLSDDIAKSITGKTTRPYFRYPGGARNARTDQVIQSIGYRHIHWTADSYDSRQGASRSSVISHSLAGLRDGSIILIHTQSRASASALDEIIARVQNAGYNFATVQEMK
ncbi:polysaccharide deacetylase family protein [Patescibacteria group bacterium]|nr:polysaccharide deacetylase family protein [Patescibacteria group bacterium]